MNTSFSRLCPREIEEAALQNLHREVSRQLIQGARTSLSGNGCPFETQDNLHEFSTSKGFDDRNEGGGVMCMGVVSHPDLPKRVYKLVYTGHDSVDVYIEYAEWLYENRLWEDNPHFPRIYEINYSEDRQVALVVIEELQEFLWDEAPDYLKDDYFIARGKLGLLSKDQPPGWAASNRPLEHAVETIRQRFGVRTDLLFDLHKGNVMLRGEILVITDPIAPR